MILHVHYDHQCPRCEAYYIPYDTDVPCPKCALVEAERFDYITEAAQSLWATLKERGSFVPPGWSVFSLGDAFLEILFGPFEDYRQSNNASFEDFAKTYLSRVEWDGHNYLEHHVLNIAVRVHEEIKRKIEREGGVDGHLKKVD